MVHTITAAIASSERFELGEGPLWDPIRARVIWVDIVRGALFTGELVEDGVVDVIDRLTVPGTLGAVAVATSGRLLLARAHRLAVWDLEGHLHDGPPVIDRDPGRRLNDGKADPAGDFVVGSLRVDGDSTSEELVRIGTGGTRTVLDSDLTLSNGLAWSGDGARLYSIDTLRRTVFERSYNVVDGTVGPRHELLRITEGFPDGMCLDAEEHLWIAVWGAGEVRRYTPNGELAAVVLVPAPHVSSVAFIGLDLGTLLITTATQGLTESQLAEYPESGCLFTAVPGVRGLPQSLWNDRTTTHHENEEAP